MTTPTREDVIRMAREAKLPEAWISETGVLTWSDLERFTELVRADAVAVEREACAKVCDDADKSTHPADLADAIRARGITPASTVPVPVPCRHQWFSTGAMEPGQYRCIACGEWGADEKLMGQNK